MLGKGERITGRNAVLLVFVFSTLDAELAIEWDSLAVGGKGTPNREDQARLGKS